MYIHNTSANTGAEFLFACFLFFNSTFLNKLGTTFLWLVDVSRQLSTTELLAHSPSQWDSTVRAKARTVMSQDKDSLIIKGKRRGKRNKNK